MERSEARELTDDVRARFKAELSQVYGKIPVVGGILSALHARWAADELIRLEGLEAIKNKGFK